MAARLTPLVLLGGLAASAVLTYVALRDIDFGAFVDALADGDPLWFAASFVAFVGAYGLRVARWWILFDTERRPPVRVLVRALLVGEFLTSLLPVLRLGEVARVVVLHRRAGTRRSVAAGTVVAERVHDTVSLLFLLFAAVPFAPAVTWVRSATLLAALLTAALVVTLFVGRRFGARPLRFALRPLSRLPGFSPARADLAAAGVADGFIGLRSGRVAIAAFALSVLSWLGIAVSFVFVLRGVGLALGLDAGIIVAVATTFSLLLPALPASVGVFEAAAIVALEPYDVADARALSAAVVIHVVSFVPFLVIGPLALRGDGVIIRRGKLRAT